MLKATEKTSRSKAKRPKGKEVMAHLGEGSRPNNKDQRKTLCPRNINVNPETMLNGGDRNGQRLIGKNYEAPKPRRACLGSVKVGDDIMKNRRATGENMGCLVWTEEKMGKVRSNQGGSYSSRR